MYWFPMVVFDTIGNKYSSMYHGYQERYSVTGQKSSTFYTIK